MLLEEHELPLSQETVRRWLKEAGLPERRKTFRRRKKRKRSPKEGQMVFLDGSFRVWFGKYKYTLLLALDDATGKPLYGLFVPKETLMGYFRLCYEVFSRYGAPEFLYLDCHSIFLTTRGEDIHVKQSAKSPTNFQQAMAELGIALIYAHSPEARGRIERAFPMPS